MTEHDVKQEVRVAFEPGDPQACRFEDNGIIQFNLAAFFEGDGVDWRRLNAAIQDLAKAAGEDGREIVFNRAFSNAEKSFLEELKRGNITREMCEQLKIAMAHFVGATKPYKFKQWLRTPHIPMFRTVSDRNILRYGNVELRVLENYLLRRGELMEALEALATKSEDSDLYAAPKLSSHLSADDPDWCLRRLMTNAGFYLDENVETAKQDLEDWCEAYLGALVSDRLIALHLPFSLTVQHYLWTERQQEFSFCQYPGPFDFYETLKDETVLFVSPLARFVNEQVKTGNLWRLYTDYEMPAYELTAIEAPVSTWPNRPHGGWGESFRALCKDVDEAYETRPFSVFVASCGCYGLPLCRYVSETYGCRTLYLGNMANALFGVKQASTENFMAGRTNPDIWVRGDLSKFANLSKIDGGRYV